MVLENNKQSFADAEMAVTTLNVPAQITALNVDNYVNSVEGCAKTRGKRQWKMRLKNNNNLKQLYLHYSFDHLR